MYGQLTSVFFFPFTIGVCTSFAAYAVRAFHRFSLPVLRQCLLNDGRTLSFQHCLSAHEREGKDRIIQRTLSEIVVKSLCGVRGCIEGFEIFTQGLGL